MASLFRILLITGLALSLSFFVSCDREGCRDPFALNFDPDANMACNSCCNYNNTVIPEQLLLDIEFVVADEPFAYGMVYRDSNARAFLIDTLTFFLSGFQIQNKAGFQRDYDNVYVLADAGQSEYFLFNLIKDSISQLSLNFGVDSFSNHQNPNSYPDGHALGSDNAHLFWNGFNGFIFMQVRGKVDTSANSNLIPEIPLRYDVGMDQNLRKIDLDFELVVEEDINVRLKVKVDILELLKDVDLKSEIFTETFTEPALATKLTNNFEKLFTLDSH